jgi:hypothetical protein
MVKIMVARSKYFGWFENRFGIKWPTNFVAHISENKLCSITTSA